MRFDVDKWWPDIWFSPINLWNLPARVDSKMITHVAIKYNGKIYSLPKPNRHHHVIRMIPGGIAGPDIQGFLTDKGVFLDRYDAYNYAVLHGQLKRDEGKMSYQGNQLFSEDLW